MSMLDKVVGEKKRWRQYRARVKAMPVNYRDAVDALQHYLMYFGPADGDSAASMFEDLADLFERAAADGTSIQEIVGDNPVDFIDAFAANYKSGGWVTREQQRLIDAILRAEAGQAQAQR